jgi:hypothetical protein
LSKFIAVFVVVAVAACAAPALPTRVPPSPTARQTPTTQTSPSATAAASASGLAGTFVTGTIIFVGDTTSPLAFDGVNCLGVGKWAGIHKGAHLGFFDADSPAAGKSAGEAVLDPGTPSGQDCKFTWSGYLLPAEHYVAKLGQMHEWQLPSPVQSPVFLTFKASEVEASSSP